MKYSQQILDMLKRGAYGDVVDYSDFFLSRQLNLGKTQSSLMV